MMGEYNLIKLPFFFKTWWLKEEKIVSLDSQEVSDLITLPI